MASRSPSPNPTRPTNPNSKTPDSGSLLRKSASSILSKHSNTQEIPQRGGSGSKPALAAPSVRSSFEQKENERDPSGLRPARARSPAVAPKGAKNFMAPTISASSKAIAASPRKKVLAERNEVNPQPDTLRLPLKGDDGSKLETGFGDHGGELEEIAAKSEMGFGSQDVLVKQEPRKVDSEIKSGRPLSVPMFSPPVIAPLDADPSLAPYDPKTNYLSPRPRFLHYRPNPRIEQYLHREGEKDSFGVGDGKRLEDSFSSESCEDTSGDTEEAQSTSLQKGSEEDEGEVEEFGDEAHVSEPESKPTTSSKIRKPFSFSRSNFFALLLVMVIACFSIPLSESPIISSSYSVLQHRSFSKLYAPAFQVFEDLRLRDYLNGVASVAHVNLGGLAGMFRHWPVNHFKTLPLVPKEEIALFHLANLTASAVDDSLELGYGVIKPNEEEKNLVSESGQIIEENLGEEKEKSFPMAEPEGNAEVELPRGVEENLSEDVGEYKAEMGLKDFLEREVAEHEVKTSEVEVSGVPREIDSPVVDQIGQRFEDKGVVKENQEESHLAHVMQNFEEIFGEEHKEFSRDLVPEPEEDSSLNPLILTQPEDFTDSHFEPGRDDQTSHDLKLLDSLNYGPKDNFSAQTATGLSVVVLLLASTLVFVCMKEKQSPSITHENLPAKKVGSICGSSERPLYQNFLLDEEMMGDSGPSDVSSSLHTTSSYERQRAKKAKDEDLSDERRLRRDSAVSSSISYGSFTTYERLSSKRGVRDEGEVTPVRRSSRIRQLTSP